MFWRKKKENKEKEEWIKAEITALKKQIKHDLNCTYKFGDKLESGSIFITTKGLGNFAYIVFNPNTEQVEYMGYNEDYLKQLAEERFNNKNNNENIQSRR